MRREAYANKETQIKKKGKGKGREEGRDMCGAVSGVVWCVVPVWACGCVDVWMWYGSMACQIKRKEFVSISYYSRAGQDRVDGINV